MPKSFSLSIERNKTPSIQCRLLFTAITIERINLQMPRRATREKDDDATSQIQCYYLHNLSFHGPSAASKPYVSVSILDPIMTIERHHGKYHIAARFNIETTILNYESRTR